MDTEKFHNSSKGKQVVGGEPREPNILLQHLCSSPSCYPASVFWVLDFATYFLLAVG